MRAETNSKYVWKVRSERVLLNYEKKYFWPLKLSQRAAGLIAKETRPPCIEPFRAETFQCLITTMYFKCIWCTSALNLAKYLNALKYNQCIFQPCNGHKRLYLYLHIDVSCLWKMRTNVSEYWSVCTCTKYFRLSCRVNKHTSNSERPTGNSNLLRMDRVKACCLSASIIWISRAWVQSWSVQIGRILL